MAQQIIWTKKAKKELVNVLQYWMSRNKSNTFSIKLNLLIENQLNTIAEHPEICRATDIQNVHVKVIYKYLIYYEVVNDSIFVLTIRHGSRNPKTLKIK